MEKEIEGPGRCIDLVEIGRGGFSVVYRGYQPHLDRSVAVKVLTIDRLDEGARRRFEHECTATGRLTGHPNIVTVFESGFTDGLPFILMEHCEGGSLAEQAPLDVPELLRTGIKLAGALESAHQAGVVHRDVKPSNVLLRTFPRNEPVLADFGISVVTAPDVSISASAFTPVHAPPEMLVSNQATVAGDVYSLGSTLWTLLAGRAPFQLHPGEGALPFMQRVLDEPVPELLRPDVPPSLSGVLARAMAKDPAARIATAAALGRALQDVEVELGLPATDLPLRLGRQLGGPSTSARPWHEELPRHPVPVVPDAASGGTIVLPGQRPPRSVVPPPPPRRRSRLRVVLVVSATAVVALGGLAAFLVLDREPRPEAAVEVKVERTSATSVVVTWTPPPDESPIVVIRSSTGTQEREVYTTTPEEARLGLRVMGLDPRQGYCFQVTAVVSAAEGQELGRGCIDAP